MNKMLFYCLENPYFTVKPIEDTTRLNKRLQIEYYALNKG